MTVPNQLRENVRKIYSKAAEKTDDKLPFPVGRAFAESIGYPKELLDSLPSSSVETFTGVSNISIFADIPEGSTVLDVGCGAGMDSLIASKRVGPGGKVIGIDFSDSMISCASQALSDPGYDNVLFHVAEAERLPVDDGSIDVALVNGIFNLSSERDMIFRELSRVVRKGGTVYSSELILVDGNTAKPVCDITNWFAWIAGAKDGDSFLEEFKSAGFSEAVILRTSRNDRTKNPLVVAADVYARK